LTAGNADEDGDGDDSGEGDEGDVTVTSSLGRLTGFRGCSEVD